MANTGIERSLSLRVTKRISGIIQPGFPTIYQGIKAFTVGNNVYQQITVTQLARLTDEAFNARLADFKTHIESLEQGLNIETDIIDGNSPSRENLTACPIN